MASHFSLPWILTETRTTINFPSLVPFSQRSSKQKIHNTPIFKASNGGGEGHNSISTHDIEEYLNKFDRRDVLFGLEATAASALASFGGVGSSLALSNPVITPKISNCEPSFVLDPAGQETQVKINCCPPSADEIVPFVAPPVPDKPRVRTAAHLVTPDQVDKYERAIKKMKELDPSDPRNFYQQANIHCAYCNGGYEHQGYPGVDLRVHGNWLFFPFHRCYLYFYERILGHLIDDPTFALPFWNWDNPEGGMQMPEFFNYSKSPLYDRLRDQNHLPPKAVDLNYSDDENVPSDIFDANLRIMYRQMFINAKTASSFFGHPVVGGQTIQKAGSIEITPHNNVHVWSGDPNNKYLENMGNFHSASRDALFYPLHGNIDRMWILWKKLGNGKHKEFKDNNWLDSSFVFYDEYKNAVRIKVRDCLDHEKLGYVYQEAPIFWKYAKPTPIPPNKLKKISKKFTAKKPVKFPFLLDSIITIKVERPKKSRSRKEKDEEDEILVIEGIDFDPSSPVHFDVIINVIEDDSHVVNPGNTEFVGSFSSVSHLHKHKKGNNPKSVLDLGITEALEELDCDDNDTILVTLIPKLGKGKVTIGGIKIKFLPLNED